MPIIISFPSCFFVVASRVTTPSIRGFIIIQVKVTPNASKNQIIGFEEDVLRVRIRGVPEKGKVNEELIAFFAKTLGIAKSRIEILSGHTARLKRIKIEGISEFPME